MLAAVHYAAAQARVRARRSLLLGGATWDRLLAAPGPEQVLAELGVPLEATRPYPGQGASAVEAFERDLRRRQYLETRSLAKNVPERASDLLTWYAGRFEVQDLKVLIRALHHDRALDEAWAAMTLRPADSPRMARLEPARSLAELVDALAADPYGRALTNAWERYDLERRPFYLEVALDLAYQRGLVDRIEELGGRDREDAEALLGRWLARANLLAAVRYRAMAGVSPEEVVNFCLHRDFGGGLAMVQRVAVGAKVWDEAAALGVTLSREGGEAQALLELERANDRLRRAAARERWDRVPFGLGLVLAYLIDLEAEASDLTTLLEAKLQQMTGADVRTRLAQGAAWGASHEGARGAEGTGAAGAERAGSS